MGSIPLSLAAGNELLRTAVYGAGAEAGPMGEQLRLVAWERGAGSVEVYRDPRAPRDRRSLHKLVAACRAARFDLLVLDKAADLSESPARAVGVLTDLRRLGVTVVALRDPWVEHQHEDGLSRIAEWLSEQARSAKSRRIRLSLARARHAGKRLGRPRRTIPSEKLETAAMLLKTAPVACVARMLAVPQTSLRRALYGSMGPATTLPQSRPAAHTPTPSEVI